MPAETPSPSPLTPEERETLRDWARPLETDTQMTKVLGRFALRLLAERDSLAARVSDLEAARLRDAEVSAGSIGALAVTIRHLRAAAQEARRAWDAYERGHVPVAAWGPIRAGRRVAVAEDDEPSIGEELARELAKAVRDRESERAARLKAEAERDLAVERSKVEALAADLLKAERDALRDNPGRATKAALLNVLGDAADSLKARAELREALALLSKAREAFTAYTAKGEDFEQAFGSDDMDAYERWEKKRDAGWADLSKILGTGETGETT